MKTLVPSRCLRVEDKFFGSFIFQDQNLSQGASMVYLCLYFLCRQKDHCWPSQATLARMCKCSERTIQTHLHTLVKFNYIQLEKQGKLNLYRLLLSDRVQASMIQAGTEFLESYDSSQQNPAQNQAHHRRQSQVQAKNFQVIGEKFSYYNKERKDQSFSPPVPSVQASSQPSPQSFGVRSLFSEKFKKLQQDFNTLFAAWPIQQDRLLANKIFMALAKKNELPDIEQLLAVVARFKATDRRWKNGYQPNLKSWLLGHRWLDEPLCSGQSSAAATSAVPSSTNPDLQAQQAQIQALQAKYAFNAKENVLEQTAKELCKIWPSVPINKIYAGLILIKQQGANFAELVTAARKHNFYSAESLPPEQWLKRWCVGF